MKIWTTRDIEEHDRGDDEGWEDTKWVLLTDHRDDSAKIWDEGYDTGYDVGYREGFAAGEEYGYEVRQWNE
jgi:flagellar biosynthesis/type III secretory pathway protein FliH